MSMRKQNGNNGATLIITVNEQFSNLQLGGEGVSCVCVCVQVESESESKSDRKWKTKAYWSHSNLSTAHKMQMITVFIWTRYSKSNIDFPMIELKKWNQSSMSIYLLISRFTEPFQCSPFLYPISISISISVPSVCSCSETQLLSFRTLIQQRDIATRLQVRANHL